MISTKWLNRLILFSLYLAIIQMPAIYYYINGVLALFLLMLYLPMVAGLTIFLVVAVLRKPKTERATEHIMGLILTIFIGTWTMIFGESTIEKYEWLLRKDTRKDIVRRIKAGEIAADITRYGVYHLPIWYQPPISSSGNDISIEKTEQQTLTVEFFINRGFLDHYSAFLYTDDPGTIQTFDKEIIKI